MLNYKALCHDLNTYGTKKSYKIFVVIFVFLVVGYCLSTLVDTKIPRAQRNKKNSTEPNTTQNITNNAQISNRNGHKAMLPTALYNTKLSTARPVLDDALKKTISSHLKKSALLESEHQEIKSKHCFYRVWTSKVEENGHVMDTAKHTNFTERTLKSKCNRYISHKNGIGRTGNQMFQVAALLGIAYRYNLIPVVSSHHALRQYFDLPKFVDSRELGQFTNVETFSEANSGQYSSNVEQLNITGNLTINGYFQSWKYFADAGHIIKSAFRIKQHYVEKANQFLNANSKAGYSSVCMHVRRGDMTWSTSLQNGYSVANLTFIKKSMEVYKRNFTKVQFIVLSDGMSWCKKHIIGKDVIYSPFAELASDMALMTLCDHVIVTSGTFGWWGAWLSGGTTVYFLGYPGNGSWLASVMNVTDYYPINWIGIE